MEFVRGLVVGNKAGHEKNRFFVVLDCNSFYALICDGKHRPLSFAKKKNLKHLVVTNTVLPEESMQTNREIRKALRPFNVSETQHST